MKVSLDKLDDITGCNKRRFGIILQKLHNGAGMVLLSMKKNDIINFFNIKIFEFVKKNLKKFRVNRINQSCFLCAADEIGIIGCTVRRRHQAIEHLTIRMLNTYT